MNTHIKYRPKSLADYIFPSQNVRDTVNMYVKGGCMRPLILHGTYGTGKSLLAELIPKAIDGPSVVVTRLHAEDLSSRKTISEKLVRSPIFDWHMKPADQSRYYVIIEECNTDWKSIKDAIRIAMDQMADRDLIIFTTNEIEKMDGSVRSRSTELHVPPVEPDDFLTRAKEILHAEGQEMGEGDLLNALEATYSAHHDNRKYYEALDEIIYRATGL